MGTKTESKRGPAGKRRPGPLTLKQYERDHVRRAARRLHAKHGSDEAVAAACSAAGHPMTGATICRVRNADTNPGRTTAAAIAAAMGVEVEKLLAGEVGA